MSRGALATGAAAVAVGLALLAVLSSGTAAPGANASDGLSLELGPPLDPAGFTRATAPREYVLPEDHGPHFDHQTEWWYYTGHLAAEDGRAFGFQLTFFRRGLTPQAPPAVPGLATNQVYFAHLALTDVSAGRHTFAERWARGAGELAGARGDPFAVWLEDWRVDATSADGSAMRLSARDGPLGLELDLVARKPLVRHGDRGLSRKSEEPGSASHYIGYTRLAARGRLGVGGREIAVSGEAWFDHEWSTSALGPGAVGWDWFSLQLDDQRELMYFQIRRDDGGIESVSSGTLVGRDGTTRRIGLGDLQLDVLDRWTSPETRAVYPARWRIQVPSEGLDLVVTPRVRAQEMRTSFVYWEGAVEVTGSARRRPLRGRGYVELTGYAGTMQGVF